MTTQPSYHILVAHKSQIYVGKLGNAYFKNGEVAGETDFFYGFGTAWVEQTSIALRNCGGGITAWVSTRILVLFFKPI
jgi:pectin methylesterase-like acyl-CoA thioesterase